MNTDRELLELAAKGAGIAELIGAWFDGRDAAGFLSGRLGNGRSVWNPLTDDGDALRLALTLSIEIDQVGDAITPERPDGKRMTFIGPAAGGGKVDYAATRRAIVRAAAEIGRAA